VFRRAPSAGTWQWRKHHAVSQGVSLKRGARQSSDCEHPNKLSNAAWRHEAQHHCPVVTTRRKKRDTGGFFWLLFWWTRKKSRLCTGFVILAKARIQ
jgi:hypothetical protein